MHAIAGPAASAARARAQALQPPRKSPQARPRAASLAAKPTGAAPPARAAAAAARAPRAARAPSSARAATALRATMAEPATADLPDSVDVAIIGGGPAGGCGGRAAGAGGRERSHGTACTWARARAQAQRPHASGGRAPGATPRRSALAHGLQRGRSGAASLGARPPAPSARPTVRSPPLAPGPPPPLQASRPRMRCRRRPTASAASRSSSASPRSHRAARGSRCCPTGWRLSRR
jgi:hypothetical protein